MPEDNELMEEGTSDGEIFAGEMTEAKQEAARTVFEYIGDHEDWTWQEVADEAGVSARWLRKLRKDPSFWQAYNDTFDEGLELLLPKVLNEFDDALGRNNRESTQVAKLITNALGLTEEASGDGQQMVIIQKSGDSGDEETVEVKNEENEESTFVDTEDDD